MSLLCSCVFNGGVGAAGWMCCDVCDVCMRMYLQLILVMVDRKSVV